MDKIKIVKDILVRDKNGIKRTAFVANTEIPTYVYNAVLTTNTVVNPEDLPVEPKKSQRSMHSKPIETKQLEVTEPTLTEQSAEKAEVKEAAPEGKPTEVVEEKPKATEKTKVKKDK